jgi:hypothetical protein
MAIGKEERKSPMKAAPATKTFSDHFDQILQGAQKVRKSDTSD